MVFEVENISNSEFKTFDLFFNGTEVEVSHNDDVCFLGFGDLYDFPSQFSVPHPAVFIAFSKRTSVFSLFYLS
jgi:hypothetical protein